MLNKLRINGCRGIIAAALLGILLLAVTLQADNDAIFKGRAIDIETNQPVANAVIEIPDLNISVGADNNGDFAVSGLKAGEYKLRASRIGYHETLVNISFEPKSNREFAIYMFPRALDASPVIVTGEHTHTKFEELNEISNTLKGLELQKELGLTLASTLKNETGMAMRSMGPAPARPVIRGLGGDRVLISEDGNKTTDLSATSPDHAVTIEPFTSDRMEVIRGPRVLLHTSTTIGGVVNVIRHEIPHDRHDNIFGTLGAYGESANRGGLGSAVVNVPFDNISLRGEYSRRVASDVNTPEGELDNSNSDDFDAAIGGSLFHKHGFIGGSYRHFELDYGVPGGFVGAHPQGVDITMLKRQLNLKSRLEIESDRIDYIDVQVSRAFYRHKEFESNGSIGAEFRIINYLGRLNIVHRNLGIFDNGTAGLSFEYRDYEIGGFVFNPPTQSLNLSAYMHESLEFNRFSIELAGRYNYDRIEPEFEDPDADIGHIRERSFNTWSLSFSALYDLGQEFYVGGNISKSSRVPTIEELFSSGPHLAAYSYETGNPDLSDESGLGTELFAYYTGEQFHLNATAFYNDLNDYIIPRNTGEINYATFLPIYASEGVSALIYGLEAQMMIAFAGNFELNLNASYTRGEFAEDNSPLPQIPPLKGLIELKYATSRLTIGTSAVLADDQDRVDDFEQPTAGYIVYNAFAQYLISSGNMIHTISLNFDNILDTAYRNHLSRIKSILPEAGQSLRLTYKLFFDL